MDVIELLTKGSSSSNDYKNINNMLGNNIPIWTAIKLKDSFKDLLPSNKVYSKNFVYILID